MASNKVARAIITSLANAPRLAVADTLKKLDTTTEKNEAMRIYSALGLIKKIDKTNNNTEV